MTTEFPPTVIIVDDSEADLMLARRVFERLGVPYVHTTTDPEKAKLLIEEYYVFRTKHNLPAPLIVIDYEMPLMNAEGLLNELSDQNSPIVVLTGHDPAYPPLTKLSRALTTVFKPFTREDALSIKHVLAGQRLLNS
jgi:CheY-like chemotaxis protein